MGIVMEADAKQPLVYLAYKCRHCNETFNSIRVTVLRAAIDIEELIFKGATNRLFDTHTCKDGFTGLADLIGHTEEQPNGK